MGGTRPGAAPARCATTAGAAFIRPDQEDTDARHTRHRIRIDAVQGLPQPTLAGREPRPCRWTVASGRVVDALPGAGQGLRARDRPDAVRPRAALGKLQPMRVLAASMPVDEKALPPGVTAAASRRPAARVGDGSIAPARPMAPRRHSAHNTRQPEAQPPGGSQPSRCGRRRRQAGSPRGQGRGLRRQPAAPPVAMARQGLTDRPGLRVPAAGSAIERSG